MIYLQILYCLIIFFIVFYLLKPRRLTMSFFKIIISPTAFSNYVLHNKKYKIINKDINNFIKNNNNDIKMRKNNKALKIKYHRLKLINYNSTKKYLIDVFENNNLNFALKFLKEEKESVFNLLNKIKLLDKLREMKFRSKNGECVIQTLANSMAFKTIYSFKFNAISAFNSIKNTIKIYKKEENAFYLLYLQALFIWLNLFIYEVRANEKQIFKGAKVKKIKSLKTANLNIFKTYGILVYNENARVITNKILDNELINCVSKSILYFYDIKDKFAIIIKWFKFLMEKNFV